MVGVASHDPAKDATLAQTSSLAAAFAVALAQYTYWRQWTWTRHSVHSRGAHAQWGDDAGGCGVGMGVGMSVGGGVGGGVGGNSGGTLSTGPKSRTPQS